MKKELPSGWQKIYFNNDEYLKIIDGDRGINYPKQNEFFNNGYCVFLNTKNVTKYGFNFNDIKYISKEKDEKLRSGKLKKYDIVMTTRGTIGNIAFYDDKVSFENVRINSGMVILRVLSNNIFNKYLYTFLSSNIMKKQISNYLSGMAQPQLPISSIHKLYFLLPPLDEQKRIAEILSTFDDLIENLTKLIEKKELYKKGVMQRVLSGKVRFNGFTDEWDKIKIKDLFNNFVEKNHQDKMILASTQDRGVIPYDLLGKDILRDKNSLKNYKLVKKGCFIISLRSFQGGFEYSNYEGIISPAYVVLEPKINISHNFYKYYFKSHYFIKKSLSQYVEGIRDGKQINYEDSKDILLPFPSLEEQNKIAELLTLIDKDIDNLKQILQLRKLQKKGVMQKLLTGEVRV